jgi:hypothetical protein
LIVVLAWFCLMLPGKFWDSTSIRLQSLPSKSLPIIFLYYYPTFDAVLTTDIVVERNTLMILIMESLVSCLTDVVVISHSLKWIAGTGLFRM